MYVKLFSKITESSIWLEANHVKVVWITLLAKKDEDQFVAIASVRNLARLAGVTFKQAFDAVSVLESPDPDSSDPAHRGRRIERVDGGWVILNGDKYCKIASREDRRSQVRKAVQKHRKNKAQNKHQKKVCNHTMITCNQVKSSVIKSKPLDIDIDTNKRKDMITSEKMIEYTPSFLMFWKAYPRKVGKLTASKIWKKNKLDSFVHPILEALPKHKAFWDKPEFIPHPSTWLGNRRWEDEFTESREDRIKRLEMEMENENKITNAAEN